MKILYFSDIHGHTEKLASMPEADLVLFGGDLTMLGDQAVFRKTTEEVATRFPGFLGVIGNMDCVDGEEVLKETGHLLSLVPTTAQGLRILGIGGGNRSPFNTPVEWEEAAMEQKLAGVTEPADILVCHAPPMGSGADVISNGAHVGSTAITGFVERMKPVLVLCGHIHEAAGIYRMGETFVVNPGPDGYAVIEWNDGKPVIVLK